MADKSKIEWTEATWNPVTGCTKVSPGCDHCYAETFAERWRGTPGHPYEQGFDLTVRPKRLDQPLRWKRPRRIFVNSMSDLFHDDIPDEYIAKVFAVMAGAPQHSFQVLTKRHGRMRSLLNSADFRRAVGITMVRIVGAHSDWSVDADRWATPSEWPLPNVWLGVSVENQQWADIRIPALLETPAAVRWLSCEPLLGPVDLLGFFPVRPIGANLTDAPMPLAATKACGLPGIDWVVAGGESGPGARPMEPAWARLLRDRCAEFGVPFFFKQWGQWAPNGWRGIGDTEGISKGRERQVGPVVDDKGHREVIERMGKKAAGRALDGRTWDEYPAVDHA